MPSADKRRSSRVDDETILDTPPATTVESESANESFGGPPDVGRLLASGDEAGTAPGDRKFRPDVQGLRAVAILLVVLFHANIPGVTGGYVGVDVFFVISGYVITGVLLRERASTGRTSILAFYGRRARRIIPAATLVIIVTVVATYLFLGSVSGRETAVDGQWAALFLANFHFAASQTNYLASLRPPSPLQNYWSLAVEEQFYIVYPTIFLIVAQLSVRASLRARIGIVLGTTVIGSFALSIVLTSANPSSAFFSPFARAWELALGGLIAMYSDSLQRLPKSIAAGMSWLGLGGILAAAFVLTSASVYPGSLVAIPVIGAGLVIAGGTAQPARGVESILRLRPFQMLGLISYSLYLWHWPILIIVTQYRGSFNLPVADSLLCLLVAVVLSVGTYWVIENPIRHSRFLITRRWASIALGACLIIASLAVTTSEIHQSTQVLGSIAGITSGSGCTSPSKNEVASLRSTYDSSQHSPSKLRDAHKLRMVVVGDSTACFMLPGLEAVGSSYGLQVGNGVVVGCGVVSGQLQPIVVGNLDFTGYTKECQSKANLAEATAIERGEPDIILWGSTAERSSIVVDTATGTKVLFQGTRQWRAVLLQRMDARLRQFIATGAKVVLLLQPPSVGNAQTTQSDKTFGLMNALLRAAAARFPAYVGVVNLASRVCPTGPPCPYVVDGIGVQKDATGVRADGIHYSPYGSLWVAEWLVPRILDTVNRLR